MQAYPPAAVLPAPGMPAPVRVLVVEDSEEDAYLVSTELLTILPGAEFRRVDTAPEMRAALGEGKWDLIIADHSMPRFDAIAALEILKSSGRQVPFIIYSGRIEPELGAAAMRDGASDFVPKSSPARLLAVVQREIENARLRRAKEIAERSVAQLANYDELTGLPNRNLFVQLVDARLLASRSGGDGAALLTLDLDRFMRINESLGYAVGDALIVQVAARLRAGTGAHEVLARLGQDEFALFAAPAATADQARMVADRLMKRLAAPFTQHGQHFFLTASIGVSLHPSHATDAAGLVQCAETAMAAAKKAGRNTVQIYRSELGNGAGRRLRLETDLRHALARGEMFLAYQPILDLRSGAVIGAEALARWRHPALGLIAPREFIAIADDTGLIVEIGDWVLRTGCAQARAWREAGLGDLVLAVNVSAAQFRREDFAERVRRALDESGLPAHSLEVEITETAAMGNAESTAETLGRLKRLGVGIAIDDFGTGYSSLAYLKRFPIDLLKIDGSFMRDLRDGSDDAAIVRTIAALARSLRLQLLAEGVETEAQRCFLEQVGCDRIQGFLFSGPLDPAGALALFRDYAQPRAGTASRLPARELRLGAAG